MSHASIIIALDSDKKLEEQITYQMQPFDENGEWFREGSRWDWYVVGGRYAGKFLGRDIVKRSELDLETIEKSNEQQARKLWTDFEKETQKHPDDPVIRSLIFGLDKDDTLETVVARAKRTKLSAFAFLKNREWHENGKLGWWGATDEEPSKITGAGPILVSENEEMKAKIYQHHLDRDEWSSGYFDRFIKDLPLDTILVCVDYHV